MNSLTASISDSIPSFRPHFLEDNLHTHQLKSLTRQRIGKSQQRGRVVLLSDGTPVLEVDGKLIGHPLPDERVCALVPDDVAQSVVVIFGFGVGHVPRAVRAITTAPIVVYEPDVGLLRTALDYGPSDLGDVTIVSNGYDLMSAWSKLARNQPNVTVIETPGYGSLFPEELQALPSEIQQVLQRIQLTKNTYNLRSQAWITDILSNLELLEHAPPFLALTGRYKNVPAFIVGAGPSLDKNVALLREAGKKGIVFATNSSATALAQHGVEPQVIACIESIDQSTKLAKLSMIDRAVRAFSLSASPETLRTGKGPLLPMFESIYQYSGPLEELTGVGGVGVCASVSTAAFSLAHALGCSPIVLVGQDMAYTSGRTYANGTGYESSQVQIDDALGVVELRWNDELKKVHGSSVGKRQEKEELVMLDAWGGEGRVASSPTFQAMNTWFSEVAISLAEASSTVRLINATEGGARAHKWQELPLAEVLADLPDHEITPEEMAQHARASQKPCTRESIAAWAISHRDLTSGIRRLARQVGRLSRVALNAVRVENIRAINRTFSALDRAEIELRQAIARSPLVDAWAHAAIERVMAAEQATTEGQSARQEAELALERGARIARAVETSSREIERALEALRTRLSS
jgi:hypothetical protein